jgi:DNA-binding transcriptional LysR family regulator
MQNRLDGVAVFVETVDAGGFSRAADRLALSRSAVAKAIGRLESRLRVRLFNRTTRVQTLTEDGQIYYERCVRALKEIEAAEAVLDSGRREIAGRLRVSVPVLFGRYCIAPVLLDIARQHPKLELDVSFDDRSIDLLAEGFDLGIRTGPLEPSGTLRARRLTTQRKVLCASPAYLAIRGRPTSITDIKNHEALLYWRADYLQPWVLPDNVGKLTEITPGARLRLDDLESIAHAAQLGLGLAWVPEWLVRDRIRAGTLQTLLDSFPSATRECHAVWPTAKHMPLRLRIVIDTLAAKLPATLAT